MPANIPKPEHPSLIISMLLVMFGMLDDILDFATGYFPGVTTVLAFMSTSLQMMIVMLDPQIMSQKAGEIFKRLLKRWIILGLTGMIEGLFIVLNLLPLQTLAAVMIRVISQAEARKGNAAIRLAVQRERKRQADREAVETARRRAHEDDAVGPAYS